MKNSAWLKTGLTAVIGAVIGGGITGGVAYRIFHKQLLCAQYSMFVNDLQAAVMSHSEWKSIEGGDEQKTKLKKETELYLNRAWARALVTLPDDVFLEIDKLLRRNKVTAETRNRVYHLLRGKLYPGTSVAFDDIMTTDIALRE